MHLCRCGSQTLQEEHRWLRQRLQGDICPFANSSGSMTGTGTNAWSWSPLGVKLRPSCDKSQSRTVVQEELAEHRNVLRFACGLSSGAWLFRNDTGPVLILTEFNGRTPIDFSGLPYSSARAPGFIAVLLSFSSYAHFAGSSSYPEKPWITI